MILKQQSLFLFILVLLNGLVSSQKLNCISPSSNKLLSSSYDSIPNFKSGAATLINKQAARYNYYNISLGINFNQPYEMAISIQNIDSFFPSNQLDFFVNAVKKPTLLNVVFGIDSSIRWANAQIYFIVSARSDFSVGIFVANNAAFLQTSKKGNLAKITHSLSSKINVSSGYLYTMPFISGLRTYDLSLNFTFSSTSYDSAKNILSIELFISYMKFPLESLYISYLIFNMASDLQITSFANLSFAPNNLNVFMGVSGISPFTPPANKSKSPTVGLATSSQSQQTFDMIFGINGIIIQTQQSMDLLFRSPSSTNATNYKTLECVSKTKCNQLFGTIVYDQSDIFTINSKCIICMNHAFYNQTLGNCQCIKGFTQRSSSCVKISETCQENASYDNQTASCKCKALFANVSNKCVSIYQICTQGSLYFQGKCIKIVYSSAAVANCAPDTLFINKTCVPKLNCSLPLLLNINNNVCECPLNMQQVNDTCRPCTANQTFINRMCQCKLGYFRIGGNCLECSPFGFYNGTTCVCFRYYQGDGFKCNKKALDSSELAKSRAPLGAKGGAITLN